MTFTYTRNRKRNKTLFDVTIEKVEFQTTRKEFEEILPWLFSIVETSKE
jgi:hypothetical protein